MPYKDPEKRREYRRLYDAKRYQTELAAGMTRIQEWGQINPERTREKRKQWKATNPEKVRAIRKRCYLKHREARIAAASERRKRNPRRAWATATLSNHRREGFITEISIEELLRLVEETKECIYCGIPLKFERGQRQNGSTPTLDRINNGGIMKKENVQIICHDCNISKLRKTHTEFIKYCQNIAVKFNGIQ